MCSINPSQMNNPQSSPASNSGGMSSLAANQDQSASMFPPDSASGSDGGTSGGSGLLKDAMKLLKDAMSIVSNVMGMANGTTV